MSDKVWDALKVIEGWNGKPIKTLKAEDPFDDDEKAVRSIQPLTIMDAMLIVCMNYSCKTIEDSEKKRIVKKALVASMKGGQIILTEASPHNWLKEAAKAVCPAAWQDNGDIVFDIIDSGYGKGKSSE